MGKMTNVLFCWRLLFFPDAAGVSPLNSRTFSEYPEYFRTAGCSPRVLCTIKLA